MDICEGEFDEEQMEECVRQSSVVLARYSLEHLYRGLVRNTEQIQKTQALMGCELDASP